MTVIQVGAQGDTPSGKADSAAGKYVSKIHVDICGILQ